MAGATPPPHPVEQTGSRKKSKKKNMKGSVQWSDSLPSEDPLSLLSAGDQGGFLSLEEIDESAYGLIGEVVETVGDEKKSKKKGSSLSSSKKRKRGGDEMLAEGGSGTGDNEQGDEEKKKQKLNNRTKDVARKKKHTKGKKKKTNQKEGQNGVFVKADVQGSFLYFNPLFSELMKFRLCSRKGVMRETRGRGRS